MLAVLATLGLLATQYGERAYYSLMRRHYERRAMSYTAPADHVVYESDPTRFAALPGNYRRRTDNSVHVDAPAWPWDGIRRMDSGGSVLFLHARTAPGGTPKRVCVFLPSGHFRGWDASKNIYGLRFAIQWDVEGKNDGVPASLHIPGWSGDTAADPRYLRFFAGQPDPKDASRFTIGYECDGIGKGTIEGMLQPGDTLKLTVHPPAATQPR